MFEIGNDSVAFIIFGPILALIGGYVAYRYSFPKRKPKKSNNDPFQHLNGEDKIHKNGNGRMKGK